MRKPGHIAWIRDIWRDHRLMIPVMLFLTVFSAVISVATPWAWKIVIDSIIAVLASPATHPDPAKEIDFLVLIILALGLGGLLQGIYPNLRMMMNNRFEYAVRKKYLARTLEKPFRFFQSFRTGDIVTRLTDDISGDNKLAWFLCSGIFRAVESSAKILLCVAAMAWLHPMLALFALTPIPVMAIVFYVTQDRIFDAVSRNQTAISAVNNQLETSFSGARIIKAFACEEKYRRFFKSALERRQETEIKLARLDVILMMLFTYLDYLAQMVVIIAGGWYAVTGEISIGTFYAFYNYLGMILYPVLDIPNLLVSAKRAFVNIDRLEEIGRYGETAPETAAASDRNPENELVDAGPLESIELRDVGVKYPERAEFALRHASFTVTKGQTLCVFGPVGSGKTTLARVIMGLIEPDEGMVLVNGIPLSRVEPESFRKRIGWVPQDPVLFSGTIRENVELGAGAGRTVTAAEFADAIDAAQLAQELKTFPDGEKTVLTQRGSGVSGGQRQRIACARAILRKPELLLFDDVTASLDATNETKLLDRIKAESKDIACILISHRISSLSGADKAIFLEEGRITSSGTPDEMAAHPRFQDFSAR